MTETVAKPTADQRRMIDRASLVRTLMGGTAAMRKAGAKYQPRHPAESQTSFDNRMARSVLFNATAKTVKDMTGKVFRKPVTLGKDVPAELVAMAENVDLTGRHLNLFARDVLFDGLQVGGGYILVDAPPAPKRSDGLSPTRGEYQAAGWRPYLVYIPIENLLGWKSTMVNGAEMLTQVRIKECVTVADGGYHEKEIEQVRVLEIGYWETWRRVENKQDEWEIFEEGTTSLDQIPLVPVYINRTGFMTFAPPLEELADLNVAHWQSSSDQRHLLTTARVPILFGTGIAEDSVLEIGASSMVRNSDPNAKLAYVEHSGQALGAGDKDIQNLEFQMQNMGLQLLVPSPGQTATGEIRDDAKENSPLTMMATGLQDALENAFGLMAEFAGLGKDRGGSLAINVDFGISGNIAELQYLTQAVISGKIDDETYLVELKRRGVLAGSVDTETVMHRIAEALPELGRGPMDLHADHNHNH